MYCLGLANLVIFFSMQLVLGWTYWVPLFFFRSGPWWGSCRHLGVEAPAFWGHRVVSGSHQIAAGGFQSPTRCFSSAGAVTFRCFWLLHLGLLWGRGGAIRCVCLRTVCYEGMYTCKFVLYSGNCRQAKTIDNKRVEKHLTLMEYYAIYIWIIHINSKRPLLFVGYFRGYFNHYFEGHFEDCLEDLFRM